MRSAPPPPSEEPEGYQAREQPRALVCVNVLAERQQVIAVLKQVGYAPHSCKDSGEATGRLRLAAFAHSVDLVLNPNDLPRFEEALGRSRTETETRYRVLKESLRAMGKA